MLLEKTELAFHPESDGTVAFSRNGMVAAAHPLGTEAGARILVSGGNAVDAACATALALCVCEPQACGLGGQSMVLVHMRGESRFIDGSGPVPSGIPVGKLAFEDIDIGYGGTTVPTTPAVLGILHERYGVLPWAEVVEPALEIARNGYEISPLQHRLSKREAGLLKSGAGAGARIILKDNEPYAVGDLFMQPELADLLESMARKGAERFYAADIAELVEKDMVDNGGYVRACDWSGHAKPSFRKPLYMDFRGSTFVVPPPPSFGRGILFLLQTAALFPEDVQQELCDNPVLLASLFQEVQRLLKDYPRAANGYTQDSDTLLTGECAAESAARLLKECPPQFSPLQEGPGETTHISVMDDEGGAVGITQSINMVYGARCGLPECGFLYNNYLRGMNVDDPDHAYYLKPGNFSPSQCCPTFICDDSGPRLVAGSPGSERIISAIFQFLWRMFANGASLGDAMRAKRLHCDCAGTVSIEAERYPSGTLDCLRKSGFGIDERSSRSFYLGAVHAVLKGSKGFQGVAEFRRDGQAMGPG